MLVLKNLLLLNLQSFFIIKLFIPKQESKLSTELIAKLLYLGGGSNPFSLFNLLEHPALSLTQDASASSKGRMKEDSRLGKDCLQLWQG